MHRQIIFIIIPEISSTEINRSSGGMKQRKSSKLQSEQSLKNNAISEWPLRFLAENAIIIIIIPGISAPGRTSRLGRLLEVTDYYYS